jgi:iron-sulfur cluster insertion protein
MEELRRETTETANSEEMDAPILVTETAARMLQRIRGENGIDESIPLRVFLAGMACSGPQFGLGFDENARAGDQEFTAAGIRLIVDPQSLEYLSGATVDYVKLEGREGFRIHNPDLVMGCGGAEPSAGSGVSGCPGCG